MTAKEMFEALSTNKYSIWERVEDAYNITYRMNVDEGFSNGKQISFHKSSKSYECEVFGRHYEMTIDVELHAAITQQMRELGWIK